MTKYTPETLFAYQEVRDQVRHEDHHDLPALITALEVLTRAGVFQSLQKAVEANAWSLRPEHARTHHPLAPQVRLKRMIGPTRLGAAEFYAIVAETTEWVIIGIWGSDGKYRGETAVARVDFEQKYERKE